MAGGRVEAAGLILAAGLSSRFGGRPKALAEFGGRTHLRRLVESLGYCGLTRVAVVTGHARAEVEAEATALGAEPVFNPDYQRGMFSSLQAGLAALAGAEAVMVLPVDAALVLPQTILSLLAAWRRLGRGRRNRSILIPTFVKPAAEPGLAVARTGHPPVIGGRHLDDIRRWSGPGGLRGWLASLMPEAAARDFMTGQAPRGRTGPAAFLPLPDEGIICDLDTPNELTRARPPRRRVRPTPAEAWQLLLQHQPRPVKRRHSRLVAGGAMRVSLALTAAGLETDAEAALLAGLLHDVLHGEPHHARAGRRLALAIGWPGLSLIIGAHTDPPAAMLALLDAPPRPGLPGDANEEAVYWGLRPTLARAALAVYLADKYWQNDRPVTLAERFRITRGYFTPAAAAASPGALESVDHRERVALAVEDWFRRRLGLEPESVARQVGSDEWERALNRLAGR